MKKLKDKIKEDAKYNLSDKAIISMFFIELILGIGLIGFVIFAIVFQ